MEQENNELRNRFTAWLTTLVRRAKINYIEKEKRHKNNVPIDSVSEKALSEDPYYIDKTESAEKIEFSDESVAKSFSILSVTRQKILTMIYLNDMNPEEIAAKLGCSVQNVYNQTSIALKQLRKLIGGTKRKRGEYIGSFALYGYIKDPNDRHKLIIDEEAAENVRYIFKLYLDGNSLYNISFKLKELGIIPPLAYKKQKGMKVGSSLYHTDGNLCWNYQTLRRMLQNEMYIGNMVQAVCQNISYKVRKTIRNPKEKYIVKEGTHEPIIDKETFYKVQERFKHDVWQPKGSTAGIYSVETGSIYVGYIKCGDCGRAMQRNGYIEGKNNFYYFICGSYLQWKQCSRHALRINVLNKVVLSTIQKQVDLAIDMNAYINGHQEENNNFTITHLQREIKSYETEKTNIAKLQNDLYLDLKNDIISQDQYFHFRNMYTEKISAIEARLQSLEAELNKTIVDSTESETVLGIFMKYKNITKLSRDVIVELIDCIYVYENDEIKIRFKYQDIFEKTAEFIEESKHKISVGADDERDKVKVANS